MSERKVIRIEVEYDDGIVERAVGGDAEKIYSAINGAFFMRHIHGMPYKGPKMQPVERTSERKKGGGGDVR